PACGSEGAKGEPGAAGMTGMNGMNGTNGMNGSDGQLRIYGDGSAGAKVVAASTTLADTNLQYTDFTVHNCVTLPIPSGAVIRCSGTFTNNGIIAIQAAAVGSRQVSFGAAIDGAYAPADPGISMGPAAAGEFGDTGTDRFGGQPGTGLTAFAANMVTRPG